jgi:hypothetical protein
VLTVGPTSDFHEQALYKRGWSLLKLSRNDESSESFLKLLDSLLVKDGVVRPMSDLTRPERELNDDALRALSVMFAASDGVASLEAALAAHGTTPYESQLYRALGDLYVEKERYQDGAEAYRAFCNGAPFRSGRWCAGLSSDAFAKGGFPRASWNPRPRWWSNTGPSQRIGKRMAAMSGRS